MPTFEFTSPEGQKYRVTGPDGATEAQAFEVLQQQIAAGTAQAIRQGESDVPDASWVEANRAPKAQPQRSLGETIEGGIDAGLSLLTGATGGTLGMIGGTVKGLAGAVMDGTFGTQQGVRQVEQSAAQGMQALTYAPRTEAGQEYTAKAGEALSELVPLAGLGAETASLGRSVAPVRNAVRDYASATNAPINAADAALAAAPKAPLRNLVKKSAAPLSGVGAAKANQAAVRAQRFEQFGVKPTEGQLTREKDQMRFEREVAKTDEGKAASDHFAEQNEQVGRVFNQMIEDTGAEIAVAPENLYDAGRVIVEAVETKAKAKKAAANADYADARAAGEMMEPVDVTNLLVFAKANKGKDKLAPIINMIESELKQNGKEVGGNLDKITLTPTKKRVMMTLDAAEDLRQAINELAEPGTPNQPMGIKAIRLLDRATEGKGGALYQQARRKWENYMKEFSDRDAVAKLLRTKPGTTDRAVPLANVFDHLILKGDKDSVRHVFRVLEAHEKGADPAVVNAGQQAARELRGAFVSHIKEQMFSNGGADTLGNVVGSQIKIKRIVDRFERNGVARAVLGKEGERMLRDLADMAVDLYTLPDGVGQPSNNAARIEKAIEALHNKVGGLPAAGYVTKHVRDHVKSRVTAKRIEKALNPKQAVRPQNNF